MLGALGEKQFLDEPSPGGRFFSSGFFGGYAPPYYFFIDITQAPLGVGPSTFAEATVDRHILRFLTVKALKPGKPGGASCL